jgi:hypothetical protein
MYGRNELGRASLTTEWEDVGKGTSVSVPSGALGKKWELILKHERVLQIPSGLSNVAYN